MNIKGLIKENQSFLLFIVLMVLFRSAFADWNEVPTGSMKPTIQEGDRILVNKLAYDLRLPFTHLSLYHIADPQRGEIVVFDSEASGKTMVKRVIGVPGDEVAMYDNQLVINGIAASYGEQQTFEDHLLVNEMIDGINHSIRLNKQPSHLSNFNAVTVPENFYLVLGDNRDNSADSRVYGFIPRDEIIGRSREVVISLDYDNHYLPRKERFLIDLI